MSENTQTMMVYASFWNKMPSFRLVPLSADAPFNEGIYDPGTGTFALISKEANEKPHLLDRLDDKGFSIPIRNMKDEQGNSMTSKQRVVIDTFYEYYLQNQADIAALLEVVAVNPGHPAIEAAFVFNARMSAPISNVGTEPAPEVVTNLDAIETTTHTLPPVAGHADGSGIEQPTEK